MRYVENIGEPGDKATEYYTVYNIENWEEPGNKLGYSMSTHEDQQHVEMVAHQVGCWMSVLQLAEHQWNILQW